MDNQLIKETEVSQMFGNEYFTVFSTILALSKKLKRSVIILEIRFDIYAHIETKCFVHLQYKKNAGPLFEMIAYHFCNIGTT